MTSIALRLLRGSFALLAILLAASAQAQLTPDLQQQIQQAVLNGDATAVQALAVGNPALRVQIAQLAFAGAKAGLAAGAKLVLFDSPESEAEAKKAGAIAPVAAANMALAALKLAQDFAPTSPADALALAQAAVEVVANQRVRVAATGTTGDIAAAIRAILAETAVKSAAAPGQLASIEEALSAALGKKAGRFSSEFELPIPTNIDATLISPSS